MNLPISPHRQCGGVFYMTDNNRETRPLLPQTIRIGEFEYRTVPGELPFQYPIDSIYVELIRIVEGDDWQRLECQGWFTKEGELSDVLTLEDSCMPMSLEIAEVYLGSPELQEFVRSWLLHWYSEYQAEIAEFACGRPIPTNLADLFLEKPAGHA